MTFPYFRKHASSKNYYKILDDTSFIEIQRIGATSKVYHINANTYFEKVRIQEMIAATSPYLPSNELEFQERLNA
jgi:hypothetical protein